MKVFITGGAGFIGSHLAELYLSHGYEVVIFDNLSTGSLDNIAHIYEKITFIEGDIRNEEDVTIAMKGSDLVIHLAAIVSVQESIDHPYETHEVTAGGTLQVFESARKNNIQHVLIASSAAVYGDQEVLPIQETTALHPMSPYAIAKLMSEYYGSYYASLYGMRITAMRFFNVYGPRQDPTSSYAGVISKFVEAFQKDQPITVFGDGEQTRDFIYVLDLCGAIYQLSCTQREGFQAVNIGNGTTTSLNELLKVLHDITQKSLKITYGTPKNGDIVHSSADIDLLINNIDYSPKYTLKEGLKSLYTHTLGKS